MRKLLIAAALLCGAAAPVEPIPLQAIDFALDWKQYIGKTILLNGAKFYSADVEHGAVSLPGSYAYVDFTGVPRDTVKHLILDCNLSDAAGCTLPITGTVQRHRSFDKPQLTHVVIDYHP